MSQEEQEEAGLRCKGCHELLGKPVFFLIGWVAANPDVTMDDELKYDRDYGSLCEDCFTTRTTILDGLTCELEFYKELVELRKNKEKNV